MAKRKTPKVESLRPDSITKEELEKLQGIVRTINQGQQQLGIIETQKHNILHDVMQVQGLLQQVQKELEETYGTYDVNVMDGTIKYNEDGHDEANTKNNNR